MQTREKEIYISGFFTGYNEFSIFSVKIDEDKFLQAVRIFVGYLSSLQEVKLISILDKKSLKKILNGRCVFVDIFRNEEEFLIWGDLIRK